MDTTRHPASTTTSGNTSPDARTLPQSPPPDTRDWTWVLQRRCPDCGFHGNDVSAADVADAVRETTQRWLEVLDRDDVAARPDPAVWSPLEYACHVRDVHGVYRERVDLMLGQVGPHYPNWDQDRTAIEQRYDLADPAIVAAELSESGAAMVAVLSGLGEADWVRTGHRSDGASFTVDTMARYYLHDLVHHLWDVGAVDTGAASGHGATDPEWVVAESGSVVPGNT